MTEINTEDLQLADEPAVVMAPFVTSLTVETNDLRDALRAVVPHAADHPELHEGYRVRLDVGPENVSVAATDGWTMALAIVSVIEHHAPELEPLDLLPSDARRIVDLFQGGKVTDEQPQFLVRIETSRTHVRITDVSSDLDGRSLVLLRTPTAPEFLDVPRAMARLLEQGLGRVPARESIVGGQLMARFAKASAAYSQRLVIESTGEGAAMLIRCGHSFLGSITPRRPTDEERVELAVFRNDWLRRLPDMAYVR